jgi:hypothetical protein
VRVSPHYSAACRCALRIVALSLAAIPLLAQGQTVITISPSTLPNPVGGVAYTQTLTASGGTPPYQFTASSLPFGLILSSNGVMTGTPMACGSLSFNVTATDALLRTGSRGYTFTIAPTPACLQWTPTTSLPDEYDSHSLVYASGFLYQMGGITDHNGELDGYHVFSSQVQSGGTVGVWNTEPPLPEDVFTTAM